jgi:hypothetical protein
MNYRPSLSSSNRAAHEMKVVLAVNLLEICLPQAEVQEFEDKVEVAPRDMVEMGTVMLCEIPQTVRWRVIKRGNRFMRIYPSGSQNARRSTKGWASS